jgi:hypothetical protein
MVLDFSLCGDSAAVVPHWLRITLRAKVLRIVTLDLFPHLLQALPPGLNPISTAAGCLLRVIISERVQKPEAQNSVNIVDMSSYENLSPQVITRIAREIQDLVRKPSPGKSER